MSQTENDPLHVLLTMDCVPPGGSEVVPGPDSWRDAERAVAAFGQGATELGLHATFFVSPACLRRLRQVLDEQRAAGMETGLLCHPQLAHYQSYLGSYGIDRQREIVRLMRTMWEQETGQPPETVRVGFFSANDYTFQALCMEGFRQGSCSLPGRIDLEQCSLWQKAFPFAHHTDPLDRKQAGTMEFYELPVTSDFEARSQMLSETYAPPHLRIEESSIHDDARALITANLDRMDDVDAAVRSLVFVTHNAVGWGREEDPHLERLRNLVSLVRRIAEKRGREVRAATPQSVHEYADRTWSGSDTLGDLEALN